MNDFDNKILEISELFKSITFLHFKKSFPKFKKLDLHPGQLMILKHISKEGTLQKDLVEITCREKATITKTLQRLEKKDFIKRVDDSLDKRKTLIYLTKKGEKVLSDCEAFKNDDINYLRRFIDDKDIESILNILQKIKNGLDEEEKK